MKCDVGGGNAAQPLVVQALSLCSAEGFEEFAEGTEEAAPRARNPDGEEKGEGADDEGCDGGGLGVEEGECLEVGEVEGEADGDGK